jgi:hypothetical protein
MKTSFEKFAGGSIYFVPVNRKVHENEESLRTIKSIYAKNSKKQKNSNKFHQKKIVQ